MGNVVAFCKQRRLWKGEKEHMDRIAQGCGGGVSRCLGQTERELVAYEFIVGQDLFDTLRFSSRLANARRIARRMCEALACLHSMGYVHRDIKPENVMVSAASGLPVIIDWDECVHLPSRASLLPDRFGARTGTLAYLSPEASCPRVDQNEEVTVRVGMGGETVTCSPFNAPSLDVWGLACSVFLMELRAFPFPTDPVAHAACMHEAVLAGEVMITDPAFRSAPEELRSFLSSAFTVSPERRPSAAELLTHPYLANA